MLRPRTFLEVLRVLSVKGGVGRVIEYGGEGVKTLTVPERATITNMGAELGATTSIFPADEVTKRISEGTGTRAGLHSVLPTMTPNMPRSSTSTFLLLPPQPPAPTLPTP